MYIFFHLFYFHIEIDLETEEAEYNAYMFYQLLEEQTSHSYTLVEDVKVTPELAKIIANLWRDKGLQAAFRYNLFWVMHPTTCLGALSKREALSLTPIYRIAFFYWYNFCANRTKKV